MSHVRSLRSMSFALLVSMLWAMLPFAVNAQAHRPTASVTEERDTASPAAVKAAPLAEQRAPSLALDVQVAPGTITVGEQATVTVTVINQSAHAATNLAVAVPLPAGATPVGKADLAADGQSWRWSRAQLDGRASATFSAVFRIDSMPAGGAVLVRPQVSAAERADALSAVGGALVDAPASDARVSGPVAFTAGKAATLRSGDNRVEVAVPADLAGEDLSLAYRTLAQRKAAKDFVAPPAVVGFKRGFAPFFLDATDAQGKAVHQFKRPLAISVRYTPEQLEALGIDEADLTIFWFDEAANHWVPQPTVVDPAARAARVSVSHFSAYALGDGSSPSEAFVPSLQGWQVGLYNGSASYGMPIDVPAGPAGIKPSLSLSYSSAASDGRGGMRAKGQAGWAGKGWSLDTGSIAYNKITINPATARFVGYYSIVVNGQSFDVVRAEAITGNTGPNDLDPTHWAWRATDENFNKVRVVSNGVSTSTRGGSVNGVNQPRYTWQVWTTDGTRYDFAEDMWWGWDNCAAALEVSFETYKWQLSKITDVNGNTITYAYGRDSQSGATLTCPGAPTRYGQGTTDRDSWPTAITWGANTATGAIDRYKVEFVTSTRTNDTTWDGADNQYGGLNGQPRETKRLDGIRVLSMKASTWDLVRQYNLGYDYSLLADRSIGTAGDPATAKLTLKSVTRVGKDGTSALPALTFVYGTTRGTGTYPVGNWNRLVTVNNGQGGILTFGYENIAAVTGNNIFANNRRVTSKTTNDGRGNTASWTYAYTGAAYNSLGSTLAPSSQATSPYVNSATLYYNTYTDVLHDNSVWLLHKASSEFRGHSMVLETAPNGTKTEHYFYQGDVACNPSATGGAVTGDACFLQLRDREILKGKEYTTVVRNAANALYSSVLHTFAVDFYDYGSAPLSGLWRSFTYEREVTNANYEGTGTPVTSRTVYTYDPASQGGAQYGNPTKVEEYDAANVLYRRTDNNYIVNTTSAYIVDRKIQEVVRDGNTTILALTAYMYDGATTSQSMGTRGLLTLERTYYDIPAGVTSTAGLTLHSSDTSYGYDAYGNKTTQTTYAAAGTRTNSGGTFSAPGNGSAPSVTTTVYDDPATTTVDEAASGLSIKVTLPTVNGVSLTESATYDYQMGTMVSITDVNGNVTSAEYDAFGRLWKVIKPGDTAALPTIRAEYGDSEAPFRYTIFKRLVSGVSGSVHTQSQFYDGLGRKIQTKSESQDDAQNIVVDMTYDTTGNVLAQSQPRFVAETATTLKHYTAVPGSGVNWTINTYDALGRVLDTTEPNGAITQTRYWLIGGGTAVSTTDPNGHKTRRESDVFGRLSKVIEYSGNSSGSEGAFAAYATTTYAYNPLDLLTQVTDAQSNATTMTYDSLGRKLTMTDPDMGAWSYGYDIDGNLTNQTDAKGQTISFSYDALNRLTGKDFPAPATDVSYGYDQADAPNHTNGKGQRTSMTDASGAHHWSYTARSEVAREVQVVDGTSYVTSRTYRGDGNVVTVSYPTGETLTYGYDIASQPTTITSSLGLTYQSGATYDALGQSLTQVYGNGVTTTSTYNPLSQRLYSIVASGPGGTAFSQQYDYYIGGNVRTIANQITSETFLYSYDHRDRLMGACLSNGVSCLTVSSFNQTYGYDLIGNLTTKAGATYTYANGKPHAVSAVNGAAYTYDTNGNMLTGGGRTYTWNAENQPTQITNGGTTETYVYDGNNIRIKKTVTTGGTSATTMYIGGLVEYKGSGVTSLYGVAVRTTTGTPSAANLGVLTYLHSDHLGSVSASTSGNMGSLGAVGPSQTFDPWGAVRSGGIGATEFNYTGQRKDAGTDLLFYNARYYDPTLARFVNADSIVPLSEQGTLQVDYHESNLRAMPHAPDMPQTLNRYSYVANNPLGATDESGHNHQVEKDKAYQHQQCQEAVFECTLAYDLSQIAEDYAKWLFPDNPDLQDAFRHAYWAALMAAHPDLGPRWSLYFTDAHEGGSESDVLRGLNKNDWAYWDHAQDFHNNSIGREVGGWHYGEAWTSSTPNKIAGYILASLADGRLVIQNRDAQGKASTGVHPSSKDYQQYVPTVKGKLRKRILQSYCRGSC
jgi:RHS repeat-associated protein/uncharacterized repeat protein (TIGR01451 family)